MRRVVQSSQTPLRHAPGLSLAATQEPPAQIAVFTDGDNMTPITALPERREQLAYLDYLTSALAYHLSAPQQVLILGAGGGADVLQAHYHQVAHVDEVEINPQLVALLKSDYRC